MEFKKSSTLYSDPDKEGNCEVIKRNVITRLNIDIERISRIEEVINNQGKVLKSKCLITLHGTQDTPIIINYSYDKLVKVVNSHTERPAIGFLRHKYTKK